MISERRINKAALVLAIVFFSSCGKQTTDQVIVPEETISLFNGKDLSSFYVWLPKFGNSDPENVFTVVDNVDGAPAIRVSGKHYGGLITHNEYADYKLITEFKWGEETWEPRKDRARDSGILLHCQGEDGNANNNFNSPWLRSVEYQIIEGGTGDIILVNGYDREVKEVISPHLTVSVASGQRVWDPQGTPTEFQKGRLDWQYRDPDWKDIVDFRGKRDVEKPAGEWNRIEIISKGGNLIYFLNGVKVNEGRNGSFTEGKLLFQSEGAELFFRNIELQPLN